MTQKIQTITSRQDGFDNFQTKGKEQLATAATSITQLKAKTDLLDSQMIQQPFTGKIAFNCHRSSSLDVSSTTVVTYQGCDVDTTNGAFDKNTGKFKAKMSGTYWFHF